MYVKWILKEKIETAQAIKKFVKNDFIANLLMQRGIDSEKKVCDFLNPLKMQIISPFVFSDMEKIVARIFDAIDNKEQIAVWGDFDADGVTATAVLMKTLKFLGANVDYYIPSRETENHGLNTKALVKLISKKKLKLLITVDCGTSNVDEVKFLNGFKIDTIITDHHDYEAELPEAYAILNPKVKNNLAENLCVDEIQYLSYLAGVGVAFKLACALLERVNKNEFIDELLPFVGVGTIADVVPLLGENRCFVKCALELISKGRHVGLQKLLSSAGYNYSDGVTSEMIAFGVAPRINAAGRLQTAEIALKLLISENMAEVEVAAEELNCLNKIRQELCDRTFEEALAQIKNPAKEKALIVFSSGWHVGIVGIVASKIVEKFNKPVFMMTKSDSDPDVVRCSARGIDGLNLYEIIKANENLFLHFGGHKLAAGLAFNEKEHSFEEVKKTLCATIKKFSDGLDLSPKRFVDAEISEKELTFELLEDLSILEPCGENNEIPLFSMSELTLQQFKTIGPNNNHSKFFFEKNSLNFEAVLWNNSTCPVKIGEKMDLLFYPKINEFNSKKNIQLDVQDFHFKGQEKQQSSQTSECAKIYDHRKKTNIYKQIAAYLEQTEQHVLLFAQDKKLIEKLMAFPVFAQKIKNKTNLEKADQIMFFDYPATLEELQFILEEVEPKKIHFMNVQFEETSLDDLIKIISGMLKYVYNNKNGEIELEYFSAVLNMSVEFVFVVIELFAKYEIIKIKNNKESFLQFEFLGAKELQLLKNDQLYEAAMNHFESIKHFKKNLYTATIDELEKMIYCEEQNALF